MNIWGAAGLSLDRHEEGVSPMLDERVETSFAQAEFTPDAFYPLGAGGALVWAEAVPAADRAVPAAGPLRGGHAVVKWLEDKLIATLAFGLLSPLLLLIAIAIRIDSPGPLLFRCKRFGLNGSTIEVLKFRTMYVGSTGRPDRQTSRSDPRVTRLGRLLRRMSLDELPQLINVLRGELSIVGPRPHPIDMRIGDQLYHEAVPHYAARHRVKPGITGLAQVSGHRGQIPNLSMAEQRVALDLEYIETWSLWLDLRILVSTARKVLSDDRAW